MDISLKVMVRASYLKGLSYDIRRDERAEPRSALIAAAERAEGLELLVICGASHDKLLLDTAEAGFKSLRVLSVRPSYKDPFDWSSDQSSGSR